MFMMKILFINVTRDLATGLGRGQLHPHHILPPLDIGYCASLLEQEGHTTLLIDTAAEKYTIDKICKVIKSHKIEIVVLKPNIRAGSCVLRLAEEIKKQGNPYILSLGPFSSVTPQLFIFQKSPIDLGIIGEAEYTLLEIVRRFSSSSSLTGIKGTVYFVKGRGMVKEKAREFIKDLDSLPFPQHSLFFDKGYIFHYPVNLKRRMKMATMLFSRGCPYSCLFCSPIMRVSYGRKYRVRTAGNVVDEMEFLQSKGVNTIYFCDDLFILDQQRVKEICTEIIKRRLKLAWAAQSRVELLGPEVLERMKEAGCRCLNLGIESGSERILRILHKDTALSEIEEKIQLCRRKGINVSVNFIIGSPTETEDDIQKSFQIARRTNPDLIEILFFTPYPGSPAFEQYGQTKLLDEYTHHDNPVKSYSLITVANLKRWQKLFYIKYYLNPRFIIRYLFTQGLSLIMNWKNNLALLRKTISFLLRS